MRAADFLTELRIDNKTGWGQTPNNAEVEYNGLKVMMRPEVFLKLASNLNRDDHSNEKIAAMVAHAKSGGTFGAPTLYINVPDSWHKGDFSGPLPFVTGHEGRHRMNAEIEMDNSSVETHIFLRSDRSEWKNRYGKGNYTQDVINRLVGGGINSETGQLITINPLFTLQ